MALIVVKVCQKHEIRWKSLVPPLPPLTLFLIDISVSSSEPCQIKRYTFPRKMKTGTTSSCGGSTHIDLMSGRVSGINDIITAQNTDCDKRQSPSQDPRERSRVSPCSPQPRWSAGFSKGRASPIITVRKSKKQPQPPQRSTSLTQPTLVPHRIFKRYSCPPIGICRSTSRLCSSSSSSSSRSSCSSPPPVPTSVITGPDPLGWKMHPKSRSRHVSRLSLQIPIPLIAPDPSARPTANSQHTQYSKPPVQPKASRRRHSDSSALLMPLDTQNPVGILEELRALQLQPVTLPCEADDIFREAKGRGEANVSKQLCKIPPPVPKKTMMARQKAKMIALSQQSTKAKDEQIYGHVIKPKLLGQTELRENETHGGKTIPVKKQ